jgi:hypothetical protein
VEGITDNTTISDVVYNGMKQVLSANGISMISMNIAECLYSMKIKNTDSFGCIPQTMLVNRSKHLLKPLSQLFSQIYNENKVPEQWLVSKIVSIFKKGT